MQSHWKMPVASFQLEICVSIDKQIINMNVSSICTEMHFPLKKVIFTVFESKNFTTILHTLPIEEIHLVFRHLLIMYSYILCIANDEQLYKNIYLIGNK